MRKSCFLSPEGGGYKECDPVAYINWSMTHSESLGSLDSAKLKNRGLGQDSYLILSLRHFHLIHSTTNSKATSCTIRDNLIASFRT